MLFPGLCLLLASSPFACSLSAEEGMPSPGRETISLNGTWSCEPGGKEEEPTAWRHEVPVPGLVDLCNPPVRWQDHEYFWYKKSFRVSRDQKRTRAFVRIEQSKYGSEVWLNGEKLGTYDGCYTSHEYDASDVMRYDRENVLLVRVGQKDALPTGSAVGSDTEKHSFIPGIWGDVAVVLTGDPSIRGVFVTPHLDTQTATARIDIDNASALTRNIRVSAAVWEKGTARRVSPIATASATAAPTSRQDMVLSVPIEEMRTWSPEDPFLYELVVSVTADGRTTDRVRQTFGMREFSVGNSDFYLNGRRIFLKGGNIAFHRFLSDPARGALPWDTNWIKRVLIDIPKAHHFNYFRFHLGHAYNRWYDLADEYGMCLQDEWMFWGKIDADREQIETEFKAWIRDNYNHPSIVIWDPLNEPETSEVAQAKVRMIKHDIVPYMKKMDPTRPWESVDFEEEHPYIYSLGPVLNDDTFGFARSIPDIEASVTPTVLNEFLWFWLDENGDPGWTTRDIILRWLGREGTRPELLAFQSFLASELVEQFRRMRVDAIAPFVYLSNGKGFTAHWFLGNVRDARPKPILNVLGNAYAPLGVSQELWDRHFFTNEARTIDACVFNDSPDAREVRLRWHVVQNGESIAERSQPLRIEGLCMKRVPIEWIFPATPGKYVLRVELTCEGTNEPAAFSEKIAYVLARPEIPAELRGVRMVVQDADTEILAFLQGMGLNAVSFADTSLADADVLVLGEGGALGRVYTTRLQEVDEWLKDGGSLVVVEPSYGAAESVRVPLTDQVSLVVRKRPNTGRGGYDSYVFPVDERDPLWNGIRPEYLRMFNGGFGGVMVSDYDVIVDMPFFVRARCGNALKHAAVLEALYGRGKITISRIQTRGRLMPMSGENGLYGRRPDPVAQRYLLNLLAASTRPAKTPSELFTGNVTASSGEDGECAMAYAVDGDERTRWASDASDPQWLVLNLGARKMIDGIRILWEAAYGKEYKILVSEDGRTWIRVYHEKQGDGGADHIAFTPVSARYVCLAGLQRGTEWGYSLWEIGVSEAKDGSVQTRGGVP